MPTMTEVPVTDVGGRYALVVSRFNDHVTRRLLDAALQTFGGHGVDTDARTRVVWVPGSFELPLVCKRLAESGKYDAVLAIGCVIRGETAHFDYVAGECARGITQATLETGVPILFGVLTTETVEQANDRAGGKMGNKGADVALAAMEMVELLKRLEA
jgi:6,7-dimethyl-8-ribityllumazine synthase